MQFKNNLEQCNIVKLEEKTLNRLLSGHTADGYIVLSASRGENTDAVNNVRYAELKRAVKDLGYTFIPVYGGYKEEDNGEVFEKSLFVIPRDRNGVEKEFDKFFDDMRGLGEKYHQDSILIARPNKNPRYYNIKDGTYDDEFTGSVLNDVLQQYFTALKRWNTDKYGDNIKGKPQRFSYTFESVYINEQPKTMMGAHSRLCNGEICYYDREGK